MGIRTLLRYLIGDRPAILEIAASRWALWVGALFVLSAAFARDYDGEDLVHEPWYLFIPFVASILSSYFLFTFSYLKVRTPDRGPRSFLAAYRSFLTLFWMTAPLAWLYAIPYERLLTPAQATAANLWTLGLVAVWRVALMVRVVSVLMGYTAVRAFFLVMAFADVVALLALYLSPHPIIQIMGGIRLTESEYMILNLVEQLTCFGCISSPVWLIGASLAVSQSMPVWQIPPSARNQGIAPSRGLWSLAFLSVIAWAFVLPRTQAEQQLRYQVEQDLKAGRITEALAVMSAHAQNDFPPQWDPPPRLGYGENVPSLFDVVETIVKEPPAPWVQAVYFEKFQQNAGAEYRFHTMDEEDVRRIARLFARLPEDSQLFNDCRWMLEWLLEHRSKEMAESDVNVLNDRLCRNGP